MADKTSESKAPRHRKPSQVARSDGAKRERVLSLKRTRGGYLGQLTKYYNEVNEFIERSDNYVDIDIVLNIKEKILATFHVFEDCHVEYLDQLDDEVERDEAVEVYENTCTNKQDIENRIESWIIEVRKRRLPQLSVSIDDISSHCSSHSSSMRSKSTTASKLKMEAEAKSAVAQLKLRQLEETQTLQDQFEEEELKAKFEATMKLNKLKRKQAMLEAKHELERRNAELHVYKTNEINEDNDSKMDLRPVGNLELHHGNASDKTNELHKGVNQTYELHDDRARMINDQFNASDKPTELHNKVIKTYELHDDRARMINDQFNASDKPTELHNKVIKTFELHNDQARMINDESIQQIAFMLPHKQSTPKHVSSNNPFSTNPFTSIDDASQNTNQCATVTATPRPNEWLDMNIQLSSNQRGLSELRQVTPTPPSDMYDEMIKQQERIMATMTNALRLPKPELLTFDGNPLHYWRFIRNFERNIDQRSTDDSEKLNYLLQYCSGKAKEVVRNCVVMEPSAGYSTARKLLKERFGEPYVIASAHIEQVTKGPPIKASDRQGLLNFADKLKDCELTLKSIGYLDDLNSADNMRQIAERFPLHLKAKWLDVTRSIRSKAGKPNIAQMSQFITERAMAANDPVFGDILNSKDQHKIERPRRPQQGTDRSRAARVSTTLATQSDSSSQSTNQADQVTTKCVLCDGAHILAKCHQFARKSQAERFTFAKTKGLCYNCLKRGHRALACNKKGQCDRDGCQRKHHSLFHTSDYAVKKDSNENQDSERNIDTDRNNTRSANNNYVKGPSKVCLPIVPVRIRSKDSDVIVTSYALIDKGSDSTLCEQRLLDQLNIRGENQTFTLTTVEGIQSKRQGCVANLEVMPVDSDEVIELPSVLSVDKLHISTEGAPTQDDLKDWTHLEGISVPEIDCNEVTLLIGNDVPEAFWSLEERRGGRKEPYAVKGLLGWTVIGPVSSAIEGHSLNTYYVSLQDDDLKSQVERFWKTDFGDPLMSPKESMSIEDRRAVSIMEEGVELVEGHYQIPLPWKYGEPCVLNNRELAELRLLSLKRKLSREPEVHLKYKTVIDDYIDKGFAAPVSEDDYNPPDSPVWYLPHHGVINPKKPEKLRVVFDCAARYKDSSLNEQLLQGPDLNNSLLGVLTRFREKPIALAADIEAMFLQVRVAPKDTDMLRFLWWRDGELDKPPSEYKMLCHLFGATSSPSCAAFALRRTADDNRCLFGEEAANCVHRNFYVDDFLKSTDSAEEAKRTVSDVTQMLQRGGFRLTKWISNSKDVLKSIPEEERAKTVKNLEDLQRLPKERTLGVLWDVEADRLGLQFDVKIKPATRRGILSTISSVYDPLGIVSPFMLPAKVLLQELCKQDVGWDSPIPGKEMKRWQRWLDDLPKVSTVSIPRCLDDSSLNTVESRELHHFGDASQSGYGAVSYLRTEHANGDVKVSFLMSKSRLAPVKTTTIPRLELSAAVLAVKLDTTIREDLSLPIQRSWFWTDSTTVLNYILNENRRFSTFVANRISIIHEGSSTDQWRYVDSKNNPADDASRGLTADEIKNSTRWLEGPDFLRHDQAQWPSTPSSISSHISEDDPEIKREKSVRLVQRVHEDVMDKLFKQFSSWQRLRTAVAWLMRFKQHLMNAYFLRHDQQHRSRQLHSGVVSASELKGAEIEIIKNVQRQSFPRELASVKKCQATDVKSDTFKSKVERSSPVFKLNPKLCDDILCVGGRLKNAVLAERVKHPPILPKGHHVCELIVRYYHQAYGHVGKEHVLSLIRRSFWIIQGRVLVRRLLHSCFDCRRRNAPTCQQMMADLPSDRLTPEKPPFSYTGVDYFGPLQVKRGRTVVKRYGCLFTCLTTRAVHIEIAHTLDTCSFIDSLHRFMNRRGKPLLIRSDNGTNFRGGERELRECIQQWNQQAVHKFLVQKNIEWFFNPPAASNMGGVWERIIRSIRQILRVLLKEQIVDDETLLTVISHVEAILNSRPITPCSDDHKDADPLTPNQILLLRGEVCLPSGVFTRDDVYGRRWRQAQYLADQFWKRWLREYLPQLQERQKWNRPRRNVQVDDIVLVVDQNMPRGAWPLARVLEVYTGRDGYVRSAKIKTKTTILTRPVNKLCLLEGVETTSNC